MFAGIIVVLVNMLTVNFLPVTLIIQSQITRIGLWILILSYLYFADYLVRLYEARSLSPHAFYILLLTCVLSPTPILVLFVWLVLHFTRHEKVVTWLALLSAAGVLVVYFFVWSLGFWNPGIYIYGQVTPWVQVQDWARVNTARDARFITPPEKWGVQESDWRVHSERASVVTLSELLVAAFQPGYEIEWKSRFELVAPGALAHFNGDYFSNVIATKQAYYSLTSADLLKAACRLNAQYIVSEKPHLLPLTLAYQNTEFVVYDLREVLCK